MPRQYTNQISPNLKFKLGDDWVNFERGLFTVPEDKQDAFDDFLKSAPENVRTQIQEIDELRAQALEQLNRPGPQAMQTSVAAIETAGNRQLTDSVNEARAAMAAVENGQAGNTDWRGVFGVNSPNQLGPGNDVNAGIAPFVPGMQNGPADIPEKPLSNNAPGPVADNHVAADQTLAAADAANRKFNLFGNQENLQPDAPQGNGENQSEQNTENQGA